MVFLSFVSWRESEHYRCEPMGHVHWECAWLETLQWTPNFVADIDPEISSCIMRRSRSGTTARDAGHRRSIAT